MKYATTLMGIVLITASGCVTSGGPRPPMHTYKPPQSDANAWIGCQTQTPDVKAIYDPLTGYYKFEGEKAVQMRRCLINKHGWFELRPPEWRAGTMAPPR